MIEGGIPFAGTLPMREHDKITDAIGNKRTDIYGFDGSAWNRAIVDSSGALKVTSSGGAADVQYTEGDVDTTITGTAVMWEDTGDTLRAVSAAKPLPVGDGGGSLTIDGTVTIQDGGNVISVDDAGGSLTVDGTVSVSNQSVQYTEADTDSTITGTAIMFEGNTSSNTLNVVNADFPLPIRFISQLATIAVSVQNAVSVLSPVTVDQGVGGAITPWTVANNDSLSDNGPFVDTTSKVFMGGFVLDEVAGTALSENDAAAARIDSKRAQVFVIEDETTRGRRVTVTSGLALKVDGSGVTQPVSIAATVTVDTELTTKDYDTGAGTDTVAVIGILLPKSGGAVAGGTSTDPLRTDPTGITTQPVSDAGGSLTVDGSVSISGTIDTELPAAAALADGASNPTTPMIGANVIHWNGTTWDRVRHSYYQTTAGAVTNTLGAIIDMSAYPCSMFTMQTTKSGSVTSFNIDLLISLDGTNFVVGFNFTAAGGGDSAKSSGTLPAKYCRFSVNTIAGLGSETIQVLAIRP